MTDIKITTLANAEFEAEMNKTDGIGTVVIVKPEKLSQVPACASSKNG